MAGEVAIHWFRRDLRLTDNGALLAAAEAGRAVVPVYILEDGDVGATAIGARTIGGAGRWWLHQSLLSLQGELEALGSRLVLRRGSAGDELADIARVTGARCVFFARGHSAGERESERRVHEELGARGIEVRRFGGGLLREPEAVATRLGGPYKVFTPFYKAQLADEPPRRPRPAPSRLAAPERWPAGLAIGDLALEPKRPDWAGGLRASWTPGAVAARRRLDDFLARAVARYPSDRDRPDVAGTSRLSPHLHWGEVSPFEIWHAARAAQVAAGGSEAGIEGFLRELIWREFSHHLLFHWPQLATAPFRPEFAGFPWREDGDGLASWQRGQTGYPLVDAGMRELWTTGWMHNRVRMVVASFLVKHLLVPWQRGEEWFWDTLVDADEANNAASWQWVAGSGADAAPYFRIFNPVSQGRKFDPDGNYIRRYVPELARLGEAHIHAPWLAPRELLEEAGIRLGRDYPMPIVDHARARERALEGYQRLRAGAP